MYQLTLLAFFTVVFGSVLSNAETTCEQNKRVSGENGLYDIKCDDQGDYLPLQCTRRAPKWCACYNKEEAITQPSRATTTCECPLARDAAEKNGLTGCDVPQCERSGKFAKKQCCPTTGKCRCVDPMTGEETTQPTSDKNLQCK